jgi:hypothetical protein
VSADAFLTPAKRTRDFDAVYARLERLALHQMRTWRPAPIAEIRARIRPYRYGEGPRVSGVYFLFDGEVLSYVGCSYWVGQRIDQHWDGWRRFTGYAYARCPEQRLRMAEAHYIAATRPRDNIAGNGRR